MRHAIATLVSTCFFASCVIDVDTGEAVPAGEEASSDDAQDDSGDQSGDDSTRPRPGAVGDEDNTFDHDDVMPDVWDLLEKMQEEGPPAYQARVHSCPKMRYQTIGDLLESRGVDLSAIDELSAGNMWSTSDQALGAPNYASRARESRELTAASASKLFDIFVQAAPEIIAAMPTLESCTVGGSPTAMFNDFDQCTPDGIACLIGVPATASHLESCNQVVTRASDTELGKVMAVAVLLAAAHTCE